MTSSNTPKFNVSASLIRRLGEVIVPDAVHALIELIKNAYDADAGRVTIEINTKQTLPSPSAFARGPAAAAQPQRSPSSPSAASNLARGCSGHPVP